MTEPSPPDTVGDDRGDASSPHRLGYSISPRRYEIRLAPDLDEAVFSGEVRIEAEVSEPTERVVLHALDLDIEDAAVESGSGSPGVTGIEVDPATERMTIRLSGRIPKGECTITIRFAGTLNDELHGFYRSTFTDDEGVSRTIATTQFEATDARRAFPCFDEPDRKAVFSVTLDVPDGMSAYSNGPIEEELALPDGRSRVRFGETIPMSTYLVAFVVGPLEATEPVDVDGTPLRVVHAPGKEALTSYALEAAAHALRFFSDWFGIPYPASKLDLVAIPDFAFGAMENLGCVTFRESLLLVDPARASRLEQQRIADVVSHEIAHMWFGDLVTMKWWNGIWLNEAFATLMELMCVDAFRPEWERWVTFGIERDAAFATDSLHNTRPVEYPVGPPEEAQGMFDVLTYEKGASVLRMLERFLGAETFREGIRGYLDRHRLGNTETRDLWDAIESASGEPVRTIMDSWILQGGFPLVSVRAADDGSAYELSQEPFTYGPTRSNSAIGIDWRVPVLVRGLGDRDGETERVLLDAEPKRVPARDELPVVVNAHGSGYFRVRYEAPHLHRLSDELALLDSIERFNILGDTWAAVVASQSATDDFLGLAESLGEERDPDVWTQVTMAMSFLDHAVDDALRPELARYVRGLAGPPFARLGWSPKPQDDERTGTLRSHLVGLLGTVGQDEEVRDQCAARHRAAVEGTEPLDPDMASAVVNVVAAAGGRKEYETFVDRYRHPSTPQEEMRYLYALAGFTDPELSSATFELATTEVRTQNAPFLLQHMLANRDTGPENWRRVRDGWETITARTPSNILPRMLDGVRLQCRDPRHADDVTAFIDAHPLPSGQRTVNQILERLAVNVAFAMRLAGTIGESLAAGIARTSAT